MTDKEVASVIERIKTKRLEKGLSYQDMQDLTGISKSTWQRYETGYIKNLGIDKLDIVAKALTTTPAYLMGWEKESNTAEEIDKMVKDAGISAIAAHFEGEAFSEDDKQDIENFINFILSKKNKKY